MKTIRLVSIVTLLGAASFVCAESPNSKSEALSAIARRAWSISDEALREDIDPPARQQMLLLGIQALARHASRPMPANLAQRVSGLTAPERFADILAEVWPEEKARVSSDSEKPEHVLFQGMMSWVVTEGFETSYLSPQQRKVYEVTAGNRYVGTGIQIRVDEKTKLSQIVVPFPGGPARKAGARPGDLIVEVDDASMSGKTLGEVVRRLQGEEGTKVSMTVRQPDETTTRKLPMVRSVIPFRTIQGFRRTGEDSWAFRPDAKLPIAYLVFDDIVSSTPLELRQIEASLKADGTKALILDLRSTRGKEMRHTALLADSLLDGGLLWRVRDVRGKIKEYKADRDCLFRDLPIAVLVNEHTGRMASLLAAALRDRGRAVVIGQPPRMDLTVTSLVPLPDGNDALLLRTGTVVRTSLKEPHEQASETPQNATDNAVHPDYPVEIAPKELVAMQQWRAAQQSPEPKADAKPPKDQQLEKALSALREALNSGASKAKE